MWQLLLAAAVAGSTSFAAKHFLNNHPSSAPPSDQPPPDERDQFPQLLHVSIPSSFDSPLTTTGTKYESDCDEERQNERIFRFSSSGGGSREKNKKKKITDLTRKSLILTRRLKFGAGSRDIERGSPTSKSSSAVSTKKKKRRTSKIVPTKSGPCSSSKDGSLFGWGLGVGIMYMMSAGKAEINKLSTTMDETSRVVQELRAELHKRKSAQVAVRSEHISGENIQVVGNGSRIGNRDPGDVKMSGLTGSDDVECPSSVLTEEPQQEVTEMDQLEAELESELLKLPWSTIEASRDDEMMSNMTKAESLSEGLQELQDKRVAVSYQCQGVLPSELDQKLCHLLIKQQEDQIEDLESELNSAQSKLREKEAELQALKDCVKRLTEFSLSTVSDDETKLQEEQEGINNWDDGIKMGSESRNSVVGMKRPISSG